METPQCVLLLGWRPGGRFSCVQPESLVSDDPIVSLSVPGPVFTIVSS